MSYQSVVSGQSPQHYYRLQDALTDEMGGAAAVRGSAPYEPQYATGYVDTSPRCLSYDGGDSSYHVVSLTDKLSISAYMKFTSFSGTQVWFELGNPNFNSVAQRGAVVYSDGSVLNVAMFDGTNYDSQTYTLPSTGVWNHWAFVFDRSASGASRMVVYKDGTALTPSTGSYQTTTTNFTPTVLSHMSRQGGSLFQAGSIDDLATWAGALTGSQVSAQYAAGAPTTPAQISGSSTATATGSLSLTSGGPVTLTPAASNAAASGTLALTANQRVPFGSSAATATGSLDLTTTSATGSRAALGWLGWFITDTGGSSIPLIAGGSTAVATGSLSLTVPSTALISGSSTATATGTLLLRSSTETRIATPTSLGSTQFSNSTLSSVQFGNSTVQPAADHPVS